MIFALVANKNGEIFDLKGYAAVGKIGSYLEPISIENTIETPEGSELMFLPERSPLLYNLKNGKFEIVNDNPYKKGDPLFPVSVFNSPGYLISHTSSYKETNKSKLLPLFSYGAVGWDGKSFKSAAVLVDNDPRQDLSKMSIEKIIMGIKKMKQLLPNNNIRRHLENCALTYGCPAGKNFFLGRYEAPIPTSKICNANCLGCISLQNNSGIKSSQNRIKFKPTVGEIVDLALAHIYEVKNPIVSFGQGCEGEPLLASKYIVKAINIIRKKTSLGTININTNGSLPYELQKMFDVGLDSMRISINSFRESCYNSYFRPTSYCFKDVILGIKLAILKKKHVAINYLSCPGFTNSLNEVKALENFLDTNSINMIQWRNLNFDPIQYIKIMNKASQNKPSISMINLIDQIKIKYPQINHGYYNLAKEKF